MIHIIITVLFNSCNFRSFSKKSLTKLLQFGMLKDKKRRRGVKNAVSGNELFSSSARYHPFSPVSLF